MKLTTNAVATINEAHERLNQCHYDLCLTDMNLPDGNGIDLVAHIQHTTPQTPVAVITAYGSMDTAIQALKAGAFDFVSKPVDLSRLRELIQNAMKVNTSAEASTGDKMQLLGESGVMQQLKKTIRKLARSQAPVYISGESGTGKEVVARMIHEQGPRSSHEFVPVNCGAIPAELMESEFFGHKKGSFTGAVNDKPGLFQAADGGTLFLDEVADLPLHMQVKLLRAIQEKSIRPVGSQQEIPVDVRILSATHKDLGLEVQEGRFRQDLFYRINVIELLVPPLRERGEDVHLLAQHFLHKLSLDCDLPDVMLSDEAQSHLARYQFPGNVRELENILERAFTLCEDDTITLEDLQIQSSPSPTGTQAAINDAGEIDNLESYLEDLEKQVIIQTLESTRWNRTAAAKKLGITFRALRYRLKKLDLDSPEGNVAD
ncbi:transcriptional regulatory protein ZraR [Elysia marginata]|uniref:Transcriptional regulatory protein ZraR n=1 Tax=Elysia marginata TaxID=1093978 RepID=A0AAV4F919_9GAST|nr:transcriptional regulatory protein ZraR [Elysia marginata]